MAQTKIKSAGSGLSAADKTDAETKRPRTKYQHPDTLRETIESLVVAFILAYLFRTFEAEAFVIPTGSMAETLNGRHKEVDCTECGWHYHIGASKEVDDETGLLESNVRYRTSLCPNCRFQNEVKDLPVFHGDRILVNKFSYELNDPRRWDVVVFKFPEEPQRNYIKRLVGLPGEFLKIERGDLYARSSETAEWEILRKDDPDKQRLMQMIVYDNDHPEKTLLANGWPERWAAVENRRDDRNDDGQTADASGWTADPEARAFQLSAQNSRGKSPRWIRYRHFVPGRDEWEAVAREPATPFERRPMPQLVSDVCGYNTVSVQKRYRIEDDSDDKFWVGDLALTATIAADEVADGATLILELTEGVRDYRCTLELNSGTATLSYYDQVFQTSNAIDSAPTDFVGKGSHEVAFANVDNRLCLWIDGDVVRFPNRGEYDSPTATTPTRRDLAPAAIGGQNVALTVRHLKLERDIYYRADRRDSPEYLTSRQNDPAALAAGIDIGRLLNDPEEYGRAYLQHAQSVVYPQLPEGQFFVLGDNSPQSNDSRLWTQTHSIPRHALLGKAFFIYWPHGVPFLNDGQGYPLTYHTQLDSTGKGRSKVEDYPNLRVPFYPNFGRMERIR